MKRAFTAAVLFHLVVLLFGGIVVNLMRGKQVARIAEVEVVEDVKDEKKPDEEKETKKVEKVEEKPADQMPDSTVLEEIEPQGPQGPALDAVSLADLESALGGGAGSGDFSGGVGFGSGGVVGGTGSGSSGEGPDGVGGGALDQKPKLVSSVNPEFSPAVRKKGGAITLVLFVSAEGRVTRASVEKSSDPGLESPAVEAVRKWVFEPGQRSGKKSPFKTRQTLRLEPAKT